MLRHGPREAGDLLRYFGVDQTLSLPGRIPAGAFRSQLPILERVTALRCTVAACVNKRTCTRVLEKCMTFNCPKVQFRDVRYPP